VLIRKKHLSRRTFLRGAAGVGIGLPLLDAMIPAAVAQQLTAAAAPTRFGFVYTPHGYILKQWVPDTVGQNFDMKTILKPLAPFKDQITVLSNLAMRPDNVAGSGHATSNSTYLNGAVAKDTRGADVEAGTTIDQIIAGEIGQGTPLPSLELAIEDNSNMVGICDGTSSCTYLDTLSWSSSTTPLPMQINPRIVFERMFGSGSTPQERAARARADRSLLDAVVASADKLKNELGGRDRARIDEYLENLREVERRIGKLEQTAADTRLNVPDAPGDIPELYEEHVGLMFDLQHLAFQTDTTRVTTFMMSRELNNRTYPQIGVPGQHHAISHHGYKAELEAQHARINTYHVMLFARFVDKLRSTPDGDGNLLDHTLLLYGSGMGDGNVHSKDPISSLLVGGASGKLTGNRHLRMPASTPHANLLLSILQLAAIPAEQIGNSTEPIALG
jgi:hypothetical protein